MLERIVLRLWGTSEKKLERKDDALKGRIDGRTEERDETDRENERRLDREVSPEAARRVREDPILEDFYKGFGLGKRNGQ